MAHYYFDLFNSLITIDREGHDLADLEAVRNEVRRALPAMLEESMQDRQSAQVRVDVRDENENRVLTATVLMVMESPSSEGQRPAQFPEDGFGDEREALRRT